MPKEFESSKREGIIVGGGEFKMGPPGSKFVTEDLGPCIGMGLLDPTKEEGGVGHFHDASKETIKKDINMFMTTKDKDNVKAYARGGAPAFMDSDDFKNFKKHKKQALQTAHENRVNALDALKESGILEENIDVQWTEDMYTSIKIELDTAVGKFATIKNPILKEDDLCNYENEHLSEIYYPKFKDL